MTDAELADYPTLTVLQEAIRQSETAMKNSLGEAMEPILAKYNFVQKDVLDLEIQDLQEQIDAGYYFFVPVFRGCLQIII